MRQKATPTNPTRNFSVPDRVTGISGVEELQRINLSRQWNFIEVDVTLEELQEMSNEGWSGLMHEMEMEVKRISKRNLGRDDRCISDHGREARFPFLDEEVVSFLNSLPVWLKTDPGLPRGIGEKQLLRQAARLLGLTSSSELPKRAIQFGSRIAKLESSGEKGSEACSRLEF
ncbi:Asparagine synthetase domain-containing protein 1 [Desmophyllum pertusum]|uniref:Asparagine synthetase domain-containing protein 1 n=1 Tax=Desmophyllum pertusum TaxID=174260 RepID=A0A9X0CD78_9CNID|nr:Asparagine synthetase domain-containing protein 1 [Desmophyllum pertusum]